MLGPLDKGESATSCSDPHGDAGQQFAVQTNSSVAEVLAGFNVYIKCVYKVVVRCFSQVLQVRCVQCYGR